MISIRVLIMTLSIAVTLSFPVAAQEKKNKEDGHHGHNHSDHHAGVNERGDKVMGFSHAKTTHHFRLLPDGGLIEVTVNDPQDTASLEMIRKHLEEIAGNFSAGDFTRPMTIHAQTPPGVPAMTRLKSSISYQYEEIVRGGRVRIATKNQEAIAAIHEFLRFQIRDHKTGDSLEAQTEQ